MTATQWHGLGVEEIMDLTKQQVTALRRAAGERIMDPVTNEDKLFRTEAADYRVFLPTNLSVSSSIFDFYSMH